MAIGRRGEPAGSRRAGGVIQKGGEVMGVMGRGSLGLGRPRGAVGAGWAGLVGPEASWAVAQWGVFSF